MLGISENRLGMARLEGLPKNVKIRGKIDGLIFSLTDDGVIVRKKGEISKRKYRTAACFEKMRGNGREMGQASKLAGTLRRAVRRGIKGWSYGETSGDLAGRFNRIIKQGRGKYGERSFEAAHLEIPAGEGLTPGKALLSSGKPFRFARENGEVYLRMTYGKLKKLFGSENPLPLRIVLGVVALSEVHFVNGRYKVLHEEWDGKSSFNSRKAIKAWPSKGELRLKVRLKMDGPVPEGVGLLGVVGVV